MADTPDIGLAAVRLLHVDGTTPRRYGDAVGAIGNCAHLVNSAPGRGYPAQDRPVDEHPCACY